MHVGALRTPFNLPFRVALTCSLRPATDSKPRFKVPLVTISAVDLVMLGLAFALFLLTIALIRLCDGLMRHDQ